MTYSTIIARNYVPLARVLARTLTANNPSERLVVLVVDDERHEVDAAHEPFDVMRPEDLSLAPREFHRMATIYDLLELSTAVKPWLLEYLLRAHEGPAIYLDPDIEVFASLDPLTSWSTEHTIVLTPHTTTSIPHDGHGPNEAGILKAGVYNLGFIGLGQDAHQFLRWWQQRLRRDCLAAPDEGYAVDQKWIDLVPALFEDYFVVRDTTYNVAYWNLFGRHLTERDGTYYVDGDPLRFFHFSGYSPERRGELSKYQNRIRLTDHDVLSGLCDRYAAKLIGQGYDQSIHVPYAFATSCDGIPLSHETRRLYRDQLVTDERVEGETSLPDPFDPEDSRRFSKWLARAETGVRRRATTNIGGSSPPAPTSDAGVPPAMTEFRQRVRAIAKRGVTPALHVLDRRVAGIHDHVEDIGHRTDQLRNEVNLDVETVVELVLTLERFAAEFGERMEQITATLETLLDRIEAQAEASQAVASGRND